MRVDEPEYAEKIDLGKRCSRRTYVYFRFCLNHSYGVQSACRESEAVLHFAQSRQEGESRECVCRVFRERPSVRMRAWSDRIRIPKRRSGKSLSKKRTVLQNRLKPAFFGSSCCQSNCVTGVRSSSMPTRCSPSLV